MDQATQDALVRWKTHRYRPTDVPFAHGVDSLISKTPLVEARQSETRKTDWVLCRAGTSTPATFVFAGVFAEADPYDTGNFVPNGQPVPPGLDESRVARHAGYKPAYSYAIETYHDKDIWELHTALDAYMINVPGFNTRGVKRRQWQSGSTWHWRYYFRVPMFLTCESRGGRPEPPPGLHEWVVAAHQKSRNYRANPVKPAVCGLEEGRLQRIEDCSPNILEYGDVISIVFTLVFVEDRDDWGPVSMISHIIRVQRANKETYKLTTTLMPADPPVDDVGLVIGTVVDPVQATTSTIPLVSPDVAGSSTSIVIATSARDAAEESPVSSRVVLPSTSTAEAVVSAGSDVGGVSQHGASLSGTAADTSVIDHVEWEMDVDDEGKEASIVPAALFDDRTDGDGDGADSSGASTLADAPVPLLGESTPHKSVGKKRGRGRSGSGDDSEPASRAGKPPGSFSSKRGAKGVKHRASEHV